MNFARSISISILKLILSYTVVLDALNGMLTMYVPGPLEQFVPVLRIIIIVYFLLLLGGNNMKRFIRIFSFFLFGLLVCVVRLIYYNALNLPNLFTDASYYLKLMYFMILINLLMSLIEKKAINSSWIFDVLRNNSIWMIFLIIIPTKLGLARSTYAGSGIGSSGFFIANNASNIVLIISSFFLLYKFEEKMNLFNFSFYALSILALWMQGSKTSVLVVLFSVGYLILKRFSIKGMSVRKALYLVSFTIFVFIGALLIYLKAQSIYSLITESLSNLIERQHYLLNSSGSLFDAIFSGRLSMLNTVMSYWNDQNNVLLKIFGLGVSGLPSNIISEMDIVDVFIRTGIIGIFVTYIYAFRLVFFKYKEKKENKFSYIKFYKFSIFIMILYSILAGHMFVEIISSTFFTLCMAMLLSNRRGIDEGIGSDTAISK